jgi:hypothetical protein
MPQVEDQKNLVFKVKNFLDLGFPSAAEPQPKLLPRELELERELERIRILYQRVSRHPEKDLLKKEDVARLQHRWGPELQFSVYIFV